MLARQLWALHAHGECPVQVRAVEPEAHHIIIADQAGFPLSARPLATARRDPRAAAAGLQPRTQPAEHVGSRLKMATANRVFETLPEMEAAIAQEMRPPWNTPASVHSLIGNNAVHLQTNASSKKQTSGFQLELV